MSEENQKLCGESLLSATLPQSSKAGQPATTLANPGFITAEESGKTGFVADLQQEQNPALQAKVAPCQAYSTAGASLGPLPANYRQPKRWPSGRLRFSWTGILIILAAMFAHVFIQSTVFTTAALYQAIRHGAELTQGRDMAETAQQYLMQMDQTPWLCLTSLISIAFYLLLIWLFGRRALAFRPELYPRNLQGYRQASKDQADLAYVLHQKPRPWHLLIVVVTLGAMGMAQLVMIGLDFWGHYSDNIKGYLDDYAQMSEMFTTGHFLIRNLAVVLLVPIAEELLFRGIICAELRRFLPDGWVIFITGALFALFHMNVVQSSYVFFAGLAITAVYIWTRSIYLSIFMHMFYNFMGSSWQLLFQDNSLVQAITVIIELLAIPAGIVILVGLYMHYRPSQDKMLRALQARVGALGQAPYGRG